ncbi:hypothetical protein [Pseudomonas syringae]|uniref:hypothetical protein n=1 Tax=Pseudomonas syringae TaxID=317 RepID=UPI001304755A|nr:hypothetical protein [Pseudomonas syringae]
MIADSLLVACGGFGFSAFCFLAGFVAGGSKRSGAKTFPLNHVSFDDSANDADRLKLLDEARAALLDGRLSQANELQNYRSGDQAAKPGAGLEQ